MKTIEHIFLIKSRMLERASHRATLPRREHVEGLMTRTKTLTIRTPDDFHLHLRENTMLTNVLPWTVRSFGRALVMPNLEEPVTTGPQAVRYRRMIVDAWNELPEQSPFEPLMTIKLRDTTTPGIIRGAKGMGVVAAKLYPEGVTTNAHDGIRNPLDLDDVFAAMEETGMMLCIHGEAPNTFVLDREAMYLTTVYRIHERFPRLKITLEHVSTGNAIDFVAMQNEMVAATITPHHMVLTLDHVIGGLMHPHFFCKPVAKRPEDRDALVQAALSGSPKFFLGTDSAPHSKATKECADGCAGIFNAPSAIATLADIFEAHGALEKLEYFTSVAGALHYGLPVNTHRIRLSKRPLQLPEHIGNIVPFTTNRERIVQWDIERLW